MMEDLTPYPYPVLDSGYVVLRDVFGDDLEPARAARVSYGTISRGWKAGDGRIIAYMLRHNHTSPFEQVVLKWEMKLPIFVARQIIRHRTASVNEVSGRYTDISDLGDYYPDEWRGADGVNRQGSSGIIDDPDGSIARHYDVSMVAAGDAQMVARAAGVADELARLSTPVSHYTQWVWQNDLHNTWHFLRLRDDAHAQWETRQYAKAMRALMEARLPLLMGLWNRDQKIRSLMDEFRAFGESGLASPYDLGHLYGRLREATEDLTSFARTGEGPTSV